MCKLHTCTHTITRCGGGGDHPWQRYRLKELKLKKETTKSMEKKSSEGGGVDWFGGSRRGGWYDIMASSFPPSLHTQLSLSLSQVPPRSCSNHLPPHTHPDTHVPGQLWKVIESIYSSTALQYSFKIQCFYVHFILLTLLHLNYTLLLLHYIY